MRDDLAAAVQGALALKLALGIAALYLLLLARSAWKQGELPQFLRALLIVALLLGGIVLFGWAWITLVGR